MTSFFLFLLLTLQAQGAQIPAPQPQALDVLSDAPPQPAEPCLSQAVWADAAFDLSTIPLTEWLAGTDATQIPWKVQVDDPGLRMDQRQEVSFTARIQGKDLDRLGGDHRIVFVAGVSDLDGTWLVPPRIRTQALEETTLENIQIRFGNCVFLRPGEYFVWMAAYHPASNKHSVVKRQIRTPELRNDPLPALGQRFEVAEFPVVTRPEPNTFQTGPAPLSLPVANKQPIDVELIPLISPPDQWAGRVDIIRKHNNWMLTAVGALSQMELADGSISMTAFDLVNREVAPEKLTVTKIADSQTVDMSVLKAFKDRGGFFRDSLSQQLGLPSDRMRVMIVISSALKFERGSDLSAIKVEGDCRCRVYHLRFRLNSIDVFDDLEKLMKPLQPRTFDIESAMDFRKAIAEIIRDLETL